MVVWGGGAAAVGLVVCQWLLTVSGTLGSRSWESAGGEVGSHWIGVLMRHAWGVAWKERDLCGALMLLRTSGAFVDSRGRGV